MVGSRTSVVLTYIFTERYLPNHCCPPFPILCGRLIAKHAAQRNVFSVGVEIFEEGKYNKVIASHVLFQ
jgi:hypothetical protein